MYYFVEPMTEADIPQVQAVEQTSFHTNWSAATYRRELRNTASCRYVVARASPTPPREDARAAMVSFRTSLAASSIRTTSIMSRP